MITLKYYKTPEEFLVEVDEASELCFLYFSKLKTMVRPEDQEEFENWCGELIQASNNIGKRFGYCLAAEEVNGRDLDQIIHDLRNE